MEITIKDIGLKEANGNRVFHIYVQNPYYMMDIGQTYHTNDLPVRRFYCGYKCRIEKIAEEQRNTENSRLGKVFPSRYKCLFVCDEHSARYWYKYYEKHNPTARPRIYELEVNGKIFWTYAELLRTSAYWDINILRNMQEYEGLFEGEYTVIQEKQYDDFDD